MDADDRAACVVAAAMLARGRLVHSLSLPLTVVGLLIVPAVFALGHGWLALGLAAHLILFGVAQSYLAARVAIDAELFRALGSGLIDPPALDAGLARLGLVSPAHGGGPLDARLAGALRLLRGQAVALAAQILGLLALSPLLLARGA